MTEKMQKAVALYYAGASYRTVARKLGVHPNTAYKWVRAAEKEGVSLAPKRAKRKTCDGCKWRMGMADFCVLPRCFKEVGL